MANNLSPNTSVSEKARGVFVAAALASAVGGLCGMAERGPVNIPTKITSTGQYERIYGRRITTSYLADSVSEAFKHGAGQLYVNRVMGATPVAAANNMQNSTPTTVGVMTAASAGTWANSWKRKVTRNDIAATTVAAVLAAGSQTRATLTSTAKVAVGDTLKIVASGGTIRFIVTSIDGDDVLFDSLTVPSGGLAINDPVTNEQFQVDIYNHANVLMESFRNLRMSSTAGKNYFVYAINNAAYPYVTVSDSAVAISSSVDNRPATDSANVLLNNTTAGTNGTTITDTEYKGTSSAKTGIWAFQKVQDVNFVSLPGVTSSAVVLELETYGETRQDIVCIFECPQGYTPAQAKTFLTSTCNVSSTYLAMYYPWYKIADPDNGTSISIPPSGAIQGIIARTHRKRNFGKAPAGEFDGKLLGVQELDYEMEETEYDTIYPYGINGILKLEGVGYCVWGNTTTKPDSEWGSLNVRIIFNQVKRVFKRYGRSKNFESNNSDTRSDVTTYMEGYLSDLREGKVLEGDTDSEAFFVVCNEGNNDLSVRLARKLRARVGLAPVRASEFIEITLEHDLRALDAAVAAAT